MAFDWNVFRIMADVSHTLSKCILIWAIHSNKSAEGVSLITQLLYLLVFCSRYLFLPLWSAYDHSEFHKIWNLTLKMFYIISSAYIVLLMMRVYARTREREKAWKVGIASLLGSAVAAPFIMLIMKSKMVWGFPELSWIFSIILESTCVLPQLLLLRQTSVPTVLDSFYLATLGSYRFFYVLNWLVRAVRDQDIDVVSVVFGLIQTALYLDFAWVYWTRQRVKLRGGAVVDSDDLGKGWLVRRFAPVKRGNAGGDGDEETNYNDHEQNQTGRPADGASPQQAIRSATDGVAGKGRKALSDIMRGNWRNKSSKTGGISISADDGVHDIEAGRHADHDLAPPDEFEDDIEDDAVAMGATPVKQSGRTSRYEDDDDFEETSKKVVAPPPNVMEEQEEDNIAIGADPDAVLVGDGSEWRDGGEGHV